MADGYFGNVLQAEAKLGRYGAVDDAAVDELFGLKPFRGQVFGFVATRVVEDGRTWLKISALTTNLDLFTIGTGGQSTSTANGLAGTQTDAESEAGPQGGVVRNNATFVARGCWLRRMAPWCVPDLATDLLATRDSMDFLDGDQSSQNYSKRLQDLVLDASYLTLDITGGLRRSCTEHLGALRDFELDPNTGLALPGHLWRWTDDYGSGGQSSDYKLDAKLYMTRNIRVEENGAATFPMGYKVVVPFKLELLGYPVCGNPVDTSCPVPNNSTDIKALVRNELRAALGPELRAAMADVRKG